MNWWLIYIGIAFISFALVQKFFPARHPNLIDPSLKSETGGGTVEMVRKETVVQRYLRTEAEWQRLNNIAHDEKTDARQKADLAFQEYMEASRDLKKEAVK